MKYLLLFALILFCSSHSPAQVITTVAGNGTSSLWNENVPATSTGVVSDWIVANDDGLLYIQDDDLNCVRYLALDGTIHFFAGNGVYGFSGDGGPATDAQFAGPAGMALDAKGNLYVSDQFNFRIRKIEKATGIITTIAGDGTDGYGGMGGPATAAQIGLPKGICFDPYGNLYIASRPNGVFKVDTFGTITCIAGTLTSSGSYNGDNIPATSASLYNPMGIAWHHNQVYVCDLANRRVRMIDKLGYITTFAGTGIAGFSGDGGLATNAMLSMPTGICFDEYGNCYLSDQNANVVRKIEPNGRIKTVVGTNEYDFSPDWTPATEAKLRSPHGICLDNSGGLYIAESLSERVRFVNSLVNIQLQNSKSSLSIFPNPTTGVFNVSLSEPGAGTTLQLIDATGKRCYKTAITTKSTQHQPALPCGTYLLSISDAAGMLYTQQLVIR